MNSPKHGTPAVLCEAESQVGGISRTIEYKGYHFDLGGHRFFTKFDEVDGLWREVLGDAFRETRRLSRIYYRNRFFNYPLTAANALFGMGLIETFAVIGSYLHARLFPSREEKTFAQWVSNRFGRRLYAIFFKTYTEKVWGIPCAAIEAEWAAQRIKGLSLKEAVVNALFKPKQTKIKTLIDRFMYPVHGPGMMYNAMRARIEALGGEVRLGARITRVNHEASRITSVDCAGPGGAAENRAGREFISSMPITDLVLALYPAPPAEVRRAAAALGYRSIVTIDIIIDRRDVFPDNWLYIHSPEVKLGRIQNFKNWSPAMVPDPGKTALGLGVFLRRGRRVLEHRGCGAFCPGGARDRSDQALQGVGDRGLHRCPRAESLSRLSARLQATSARPSPSIWADSPISSSLGGMVCSSTTTWTIPY